MLPKGKNLLPSGANSFLSQYTSYHKGTGMQESKQEVTKVISLVEMAKNLPSASRPFYATSTQMNDIHVGEIQNVFFFCFEFL